MSRRRFTHPVAAGLVAGSLLLGGVSGASAAHPDTAPATVSSLEPEPLARTPSQTVTLITGDRVMLADEGQVVIEHNPDRMDIHYSTFRQAKHVYVIPSDAAPMIASGELDRQLFDVTALLLSQQHTENGALPLIVTPDTGAVAPARRSLAASGTTIVRELPSARGLALRAGARSTSGLWDALTVKSSRGLTLRDGIANVWLDAVVKTALDQSVPQIGAPAAWAAGFDGEGAAVAVVDSGIDATHPDLAGKVVGAANFTDEANGDLSGHGTHVASTLAGTGAASGGANRGVAPGADLLDAKVCNGNGDCLTSDIIAGMEWAAQQGADVVNMSLGGLDSAGVDPLEQAVNTLTADHDTLFVIAAGNNGQDRSLNSPSTADAALAVGAVDGSDALASFSSRGPRLGDSAIKPDITAPGVDITAARSSTGRLGFPGQDYVDLDGTSMATPHVAGAAAILGQRRPGWSAADLKAALMGSADPNPGLDPFAQGAGRLDVARGHQQAVFSDPPSISLGQQRWPVDSDTVLTRDVTYHNRGTSAVTLSLDVTATGPDGAPSPPSMFTLSASSITVPAGGQATVTLTADLRLSTVPDGTFSGAITASGGDTLVRTPFALDRLEGYFVHINNINRAGQQAQVYTTFLVRLDLSQFFVVSNFPGTFTGWLPAEDYILVSVIRDFGPQGSSLTDLIDPVFTFDHEQTLTLDARVAEPVQVSVVDDPQAQRYTTEVGIQHYGQPAMPSFTSLSPPGQGMFTAQLGEATDVEGLVTKINAILLRPGPDGTELDAPRAYHLAWFPERQFPTGFTRSVSTASLATVETSYGRQAEGSVGFRSAIPQPGQAGFVSSGSLTLPMTIPFDVTVFYSTDNNVHWSSTFIESNEQQEPISQLVSTVSSRVQYVPGSTHQESWNRPVYGPSFTTTLDPQNWVVRTGDAIFANIPLVGDGSGHAGHPSFFNATNGRVELEREGVSMGVGDYPITGWERFAVPPGHSTYRLEASVERMAPVELSTRVEAAWTFTSDTVNDGILRLPLLAATFAPDLDEDNTAPAGGTFQIPVTVAAQPGSAASGVRSLAVQYSTDDGATWQDATVAAQPNGTYLATVAHPDTTGYVSLRAQADDWAGNAVEQEVIRAYRIAPVG